MMQLAVEGLLKSDGGDGFELNFEQINPAPVTSSQPKDPEVEEAAFLWRRTLQWLVDGNQVTVPAVKKFLDVSERIAKELVARLEKEGVVAPHVAGKGRRFVHCTPEGS